LDKTKIEIRGKAGESNYAKLLQTHHTLTITPGREHHFWELEEGRENPIIREFLKGQEKEEKEVRHLKLEQGIKEDTHHGQVFAPAVARKKNPSAVCGQTAIKKRGEKGVNSSPSLVPRGRGRNANEGHRSREAGKRDQV